MQQILLIVWGSSFVIELASAYFGLKSLRQELKKPEFSMVVKTMEYLFTQTPNGKKINKLIFNPYSYFLYALIGFIISPFLVPITTVTLFKKVFKIKSKLDKKIDEQNQALETTPANPLTNEGIITIDDLAPEDIVIDTPETNEQTQKGFTS